MQGVGAHELVAAQAGIGAGGRDQLRQLSKILGGGSQQELVVSAARAAQTKAVEAQDALQMREQHLDLLAFTPRRYIGVRFGDASPRLGRSPTAYDPTGQETYHKAMLAGGAAPNKLGLNKAPENDTVCTTIRYTKEFSHGMKGSLIRFGSFDFQKRSETIGLEFCNFSHGFGLQEAARGNSKTCRSTTFTQR